MSNHNDPADRIRIELLAELAHRIPDLDLSVTGLVDELPDEDDDTSVLDVPPSVLLDPTPLDDARALCAVLEALESDHEWLEQSDPIAWRDETRRVALVFCETIARGL